MSDVARIRREYLQAALDEAHVAPDPLLQFRRWFDQAIEAQALDPTAAALATATRDGAPSVRIVLVKEFGERGFTFYTDYRSRKGRELAENARAALCVYWGELERQVRIEGRVARIGTDESEAYWRTRPLASRHGAWASLQSGALSGRAELEARVAAAAREHGHDPPLPPHWGGYVLRPERLEFWQGRESRLHDRIEYLRDGTGWRIQRLSP